MGGFCKPPIDPNNLDYLCRVNSFVGADIHTAATILAQCWIDHKVTIDFSDCAIRAFCFTGSTAQAFISNNHVRHKCILSSIADGFTLNKLP